MAVTVTLMEVQSALGLTTDEAARHYPVATALVTEYARGSDGIPVEIVNEATVRLTGFLANTATSHGGIREQKVDDLSVSYFANNKNALRNSGAENLLSSFKQRRAV